MQSERFDVQRFGEGVSIPQAVWIACNAMKVGENLAKIAFQYRKRYGLHAIDDYYKLKSRLGRFNTASGMDCMQYPDGSYRAQPPSWFQYRKRYGLHAMKCIWKNPVLLFSFNTASGMDCMQYRPSQPLGQLNPEAGFLNGSLFLANRRNLAGFFCRQNRLKTSANPVISRKLLSTGKI
mgnify:CR=1 FL=1